MNGLRYITRLGLVGYKASQGRSHLLKCVPALKETLNRNLCVTKGQVDVLESSDYDTQGSPVFDILRNAGLDMETITKEIDKTPEVLNMPPNQLEKCFNELIHNGFTGSECLRMVALYPPLLRLKQGQISLALECWRGAQLGDSRVISLLRNCPHFICMDLSEIPRRIPLLKSLSNQKNVANLLKNAPNLMFEKWDGVLAKMDYLENVMKIDKKHILNTYALNRSLIFLKSRHVFLDRCGIYTPRKPKADPNEPSKNPALSTISDSSDEYFATKVAKLTVEEYEVFKDLYMQELEDEEDEYNSGSESE